jgi:hypothetical protein
MALTGKSRKYTIGAACLLLLFISGQADAKAVVRASVPAPLEYSCETDADCTIKDVGSCCGYTPRCVNLNAEVDPEAVKANCESAGMASICGFREIQSCACVNNLCQPAGGVVAQ